MKKKHFVQIEDNRNYEEIRLLLKLKDEIELNRESPIGKTGIYEFDFNSNNVDDMHNNEDTDDEDDDYIEEKEKEKNKKVEKEDKKTIASGVYALKFYLTETSFKNIYKKYKK